MENYVICELEIVALAAGGGNNASVSYFRLYTR